MTFDGSVKSHADLKANQRRMFAAVHDYCDETCFQRGAPMRPFHDAFDDSHGRSVRRRIFPCPQAATLEALNGWPGLQTVLAVETICSVNGTFKTDTDIRYFLCSCNDAPEVLAGAIRMHWRIENSLHWVLDVTFREDDCRIRDRAAAHNIALLRKIAINLVSRHQKSKVSLKGRRKMTTWGEHYMLQLILEKFHA